MSQSSPSDFKIPRDVAAKKGLPLVFQWFKKQTEGCFADADSKELAISPCFLAHDYEVVVNGEKSTKKAYAYETSIDSLLDFISSPDNKHGYELVRGDFKPFFDIDAKVPASENVEEQASQYLKDKKPLISKFVTDLWGHDALPLFLNGSRLIEDGNAKMSFHIVVTNRKLRVIDNKYMGEVAERLNAVVGGGVDIKVYTKHRVFRLPNASKYGDDVKLKIVREVLPPELQALDDKTLLRKSLITVMDDDVVAIPIEPQVQAQVAQAQGSEPNPKRRRTDDGDAAAGAGANDDLVPVIQRGLQEFLDISGDSKTVVSKLKQYEKNGKISFQCINNGVRRCLLDPFRRTIHVKNNCLLFVDPLPPHFIVQYKCLSNCPAAHTYKCREAVDVGALVASNGGFQAYPGTEIATRLRMNLPPPLPLCRPDAPVVVQAQASASANAAETWEARIAKLRVVVSRLHVFDNIVFESLTHLAHNAPAYEKAFEEIFIDYYKLRKPKHMISLPLPWTMWAKRQALPIMASETVIAILEGFVAENVAACALRYAKGILVANHKDKAEAALEALMQEYPQHREDIAEALDHVRTLTCSVLTKKNPMYEYLSISKTPITSLVDPLEILRYIYVECQSYCAVRSFLDNIIAFVRDGSTYVWHNIVDDSVDYVTQEALRKSYHDLKYLELVNGNLKAQNVFDRWCKDKKPYVYEKMRPDPKHVADPEIVFNTWGQIKAYHSRPIDQALAEQIAAPIFDFIRNTLCSGIEVEFDFFKRWLASIIQRPWKRTEIAVVLISGQGTGKSTLANFLVDQVFGTKMAAQTGNAKDDMCGRFSDTAKNRTFMVINEADNLRKLAATIKDHITSTTMRWEIKGGKIYNDVPLFVNYMFTTNSMDAIKIEGDDRRMFIPTISREHLKSEATKVRFFKNLTAILNHPQAGVAFAQVLEKVDLGDFDNFIGVNGRPISSIHKMMAAGNASIAALILSAIVNTPLATAIVNPSLATAGVVTSAVSDDTRVRIKTSNLHEVGIMCDTIWFTHGKRTTRNDISMLVRDAMVNNIKTIRGTKYYHFSKNTLREKLEETGKYIEDVELPEGYNMKLAIELD